MNDLIERYNQENNIPRNYKTVITMAQKDIYGLSFRFESTQEPGALPICQYAYWNGERLCYSDKARWFLPGDICFETFSSAERYRDAL